MSGFRFDELLGLFVPPNCGRGELGDNCAGVNGCIRAEALISVVRDCDPVTSVVPFPLNLSVQTSLMLLTSYRPRVANLTMVEHGEVTDCQSGSVWG